MNRSDSDNEPLKISFLLSSLRLSGGVLVIIEVANRLVTRGYDVSFIVPKANTDLDILNLIDNKVKIIITSLRGTSNINILKKVLLSLDMALKVPRSDFVISTHTPTTVSGAIASNILRKGIPVWYYQDYPEMFDKQPASRWLLRNALKWNCGAITISNYARDELLRMGVKRTIRVIGNGLSNIDLLHPIAVREHRDQGTTTQNILFLGDSRPRKGLADFLEAVRLVYRVLPDIHLWIVSKEDLEINSEVPFDFFHRPSVQELAQLYGLCDLFVSASWWEGFGLPPLEAMACGAPVVTTDSRGVRDYIINGENAILVESRNPRALADGIVKVLSDPKLSGKFRANGIKTASFYSWDRVIDRFEEFLHDLKKDLD